MCIRDRVREGDLIKIDIPGRELNILVDKQELEKRRKEWQPPEPKVNHGYLARYAQPVSYTHLSITWRRWTLMG